MSKIPVLILCHTIFFDVFREYSKPTPHQESAKFLVRYVIEKQTDLELGSFVAITSKQVKECLWGKLPYNQGHPDFPAQILIVLENLILSIKPPVKNLDESVIIIADLLSSRVEEVLLVSNMPKKTTLAIEFYQKSEKSSRKWKEKNLPFKVINTSELEKLLRKIDPETCTVIDERIKEQSPA